MANNRLYIVDSVSGERFMLAKSWGKGWEIWHDTPQIFQQQLEDFFDGIDIDASFGNAHGKTQFTIVSENE